MNALSLTIPELSSNKNYPWFNNFIASILYSKYSKELIYKNDDILQRLKEIFKFTADTKTNLDECIRIATNSKPLINVSDDNNLSYINSQNEETIISDLNINTDLYDYLLKHEKQLTAFFLPKFLEYIKSSSCISIERYNSKNYIGLNDMVDYVKETRYENGLFGFNRQKIEEFKFKLKDVKQRDQRIKYSNACNYILINKWNNINKPKILDTIAKMDQYDDDDGIDNKYRLSSIYYQKKNKDDLNITDNIEEIIVYNGYHYNLDSCIISNNNDKDNSQLVTCLNYDSKKYAYISNQNCTQLHELKSFNEEFKIYSFVPCELFKGRVDSTIINDIKTFNSESCYTLIYVKGKKLSDIDNEKKAKEAQQKAEQKIEEARKKAERKAKEEEEEEKQEKFNRLEELEKDIDKKNKKFKDLRDYYGKIYEEDIVEIGKIITSASKNRGEFNKLIKLITEYEQLLKTYQIEFKRDKFEDWIKKIYEIQEEIDSNIKKNQTINSKPGVKTKGENDFLIIYDNIIIYLNKYINFIINLLSRQNTISLLKDEIKDLPDNKRINQILDAISKLPNVDQFKELNDLLTPTDAKIDQILDTISKLPNDTKLKKIEDLLKPTDTKLNQILEAISKMPNQDYTKIIQDAIAKMPKEDYTKIIQDAIAKMPKEDNKKLIENLNEKMDVMQQTLLSKIEEQRAIVTRNKSKDNITLQTEIDELKRQLQLMGDIQKQLSEATKIDHTKIIEDLTLKLDTIQNELLKELKELKEQKQLKKSSSSSSKDNITLKSEISSLNQQLQLLGEIQKKLSETGSKDNKQLLADMQQELINYSQKDNDKIILGVQDLLRSFNEKIILKQTENDIRIHKEHLSLLKEIKLQLDKDINSKSKKDERETELLKLENVELKKQIEILKDIQMKCKRQQKDYERCNKHNMLPYQYIKFKEDELLDAIKDHFKSSKKPSDKIIIEFIFQYFEKNNKVMNLYIIEKYMGDIYDVMKIFNKKYNIDSIDIKHFYRLLAAISIYAKFNDKIKKIFIK
jgi:hypothetical protein